MTNIKEAVSVYLNYSGECYQETSDYYSEGELTTEDAHDLVVEAKEQNEEASVTFAYHEDTGKLYLYITDTEVVGDHYEGYDLEEDTHWDYEETDNNWLDSVEAYN